ncbi:exopolyphosphatase [Halioxenophilus sp. WMMB6]|uniref:Ppx/GppA phosphatase family protein n=1 Tax=Halioxenophilus sp. WMMB6 TaxID=3073815 RepID=UPI00295E46E8|nr:exopolyphosphatase [Halioxenophilus sp. WMMB6]
MLIVRENQGSIEVIDRVKDMVQIARGLKNGTLTEEAIDRALTCLACFKERIQEIPRTQVKAIGTKALRAATNAPAFLRSAEQTLGIPIQLVSGFEEARLVYIGVAQSISHDHRKRLVVDIGGASTEFIIGQGYRPLLLESQTMGCVTFTDQYLSNENGELIIDAGTMSNAYLAACEELEAIRRIYCNEGWDITYGTSGTMKSVADLMPEKTPTGVITRDGIHWLYAQVVNDGRIRFDDIPKARRHVLAGGIAILKAVFDQLNISELHVSNAALKEGVIHETVGRLKHYDIRDETVEKQQRKYRIDRAQAKRVKITALALMDQLNLADVDGINPHKILGWAALLHEVGLALSHSGYHHHGKYILENCDLAGFNQYEQFLLATLVGLHRRKINTQILESLNPNHRDTILIMTLCLRLAVVFNRKRDNLDSQPHIVRDGDSVRLEFGEGWLGANPLTQRSLLQERDYLARIGIKMELR